MVNIFVGHYGSGKSTIVANMAVEFKESNPDKTVLVINLDIVNPYFGTSDCVELFQKHGIEYVGSAYANTNIEIPSFGGDINRIADFDGEIFVDVGGDDAGAVVLGALRTRLGERPVNMFLVINKYRPLSDTPELICDIAHEIEQASRLKLTHIINNSNLGKLTTEDDITNSFEYAKRVSDMLNLPVISTASFKKPLFLLENKYLGGPK